MNRYLIFFLFAGTLFLGGCAPCTNCGRTVQSVEVSRQVRLADMSDDYNYYLYRNGGFAPTAILGLEKRYSVQSSFWKLAQPTERQWNSWAQEYISTRGHFNDFYGISMIYKGYKVIAPDGEQVGIYYSGLEQMTFRFLANDVVQIYPPRPSSQQLVRRGFYD